MQLALLKQLAEQPQPVPSQQALRLQSARNPQLAMARRPVRAEDHVEAGYRSPQTQSWVLRRVPVQRSRLRAWQAWRSRLQVWKAPRQQQVEQTLQGQPQRAYLPRAKGLPQLHEADPDE